MQKLIILLALFFIAGCGADRIKVSPTTTSTTITTLAPTLVINTPIPTATIVPTASPETTPESTPSATPIAKPTKEAVEKIVGYWLSNSNQYFMVENAGDKQFTILTCQDGLITTGTASVTSDDMNSIKLSVRNDLGIRYKLSYNFDEKNKLTMLNELGEVEQIEVSSAKAYKECVNAEPYDIKDMTDVQGFYGDWQPVGGGEGGRISIEFRNRTAGNIVFLSEGEEETYYLGVKKTDGKDMDIGYSLEDGSDQHTAHLTLTDKDHLTLKYDNGVIEKYEKA